MRDEMKRTMFELFGVGWPSAAKSLSQSRSR